VEEKKGRKEKLIAGGRNWGEKGITQRTLEVQLSRGGHSLSGGKKRKRNEKKPHIVGYKNYFFTPGKDWSISVSK